MTLAKKTNRGGNDFFQMGQIAKCSKDTAIRDINDLIEKNILWKDDAGGRSTNYDLIG